MPLNDPRYLIDTWSPLSHKSPLRFGRTETPQGGFLAPSWVGPNWRRLAAYKVLQAYLGNVARLFVGDGHLDETGERREYGDPSTLRDALKGALLGDEQSIEVEGASDDAPDTDGDEPLDTDEGDEADNPKPTATDTNGPDPAAEKARIEAAQERQDWLDEWADDEHLIRKVNETEGKAIGLGDGVYVLRWSNRKQRALLRIYDPGFYFPVLSQDDDDEYPLTVHIAWEFEERDQMGQVRAYVRRISYRMGRIEEASINSVVPTAIVTTSHMQTWWEPSPITDGEGVVKRKLAYQDEATDMTCYLSDGVWLMNDIAKTGITDLDPNRAEWRTNDEGVELRDLDLGIDFIPVVHVPNTSSEEEHYGVSSLMNVAQIFDDIANADTDLQAAASTTGTPPIVVHGAKADDSDYKAGKVWNVQTGGGLDVVDTSKSLDALIKYRDALLDRVQTNARVPGAVLGRVDPGKIASGVLLALSFGPLAQVVKEMRLVRVEKYPLLLKFVQRLAIVGGTLKPPVLPAQLVFGSFLPSDKAAMVEMVRSLIGNGTDPALISRQTGLSMLVEVGMDLGDAAEELDRIEGEDFAGAVRLLDATGDEQAVYDYLKREKPAETAADLARKAFTLPAVPGSTGPPPTTPQPGNLNAPPANQPPQNPPQPPTPPPAR